LGEPLGEPSAADQAAAREADVEITQEAAPGEPACPLFETVEMARGVAAAHHSADRGADHHVGCDAVRQQRAEHADMGKAARAAAAEREPDGRALGGWPDRLGISFGAAIAVARAAPTLEDQCHHLRCRHDRAGSVAGQQFNADMVKELAVKGDEIATPRER
jgi:hypothetical protein